MEIMGRYAKYTTTIKGNIPADLRECGLFSLRQHMDAQDWEKPG